MEQLFAWVTAVVAAGALLALVLLIWRTRGLYRRLLVTLLAVALLPAVVVGVVTWREMSDLGRLAEAPGLRTAVDASVELAQAMLRDRSADLARRADEGRLDEPGFGSVRVLADGTWIESGAAEGLGERLAPLRGAGRLEDPPLVWAEVDAPATERRIAVSVIEPELAASLDEAAAGASRLRQLGLYYGQIVRGRALLVAATVLLATVLLAWAVSAALTSRLVRPLADLAEATRKLSGGERDLAVSPRGVDEVRELELAFNEMTARLVDSEAALRRSERLAAWQGIARRLAHEIKNPLTPIALAIHRARRRVGDAVVDESLVAIEEETRNLQRLAEEFSALGRLPAPRLQPVDAGAIAREVASLYLPSTVRAEFEGEVRLLADEGQLRQVFANLFKNAVEAMGDTGRIRVTLDASGPHARLVIEDDGPGLPDDVEQLFEPEFTTRSSGTGLGLAIVRRIVEDHAGSVSAGAAPDGGARFEIQWPRAGEEADDG